MSDTDPRDTDLKEIPLVGIHQIGFHGAIDEDDIQCRTRQMIARSLNTRSVVAFVGSGVSAAYRHKNWDMYAADLVNFTLNKIREKKLHVQSHQKTALESFRAQNDPQAPIKITPDQEKSTTPRPSLARSDQTLMILDLCDELFAAHGPEVHMIFRNHSADLIEQSRDAKSIDLDPLRLLIEKLEIRRFLTTNYDLQIETALIKNLNCRIRANYEAYRQTRDDHDAVKLVARSLIHSPHSIEDLSQFAVAAPGYEWGVFHLHGVRNDPRSMVVTERDYQRIYLQEDRDHRAFREALQVAFVGNAILFLGIGMEEADLLRPLRQFVSEAAHGGYERPIFALLPDRPDAAEFRYYLYSRYGVKTLYYPVKEGEDGLTKSFCRAIENLAKSWSLWWQGWQKKPVVRKPYFHMLDEVKRNVMIRHSTNTKSLFRVDKDKSEVAKELNGNARALIVMGLPGSGKGTLGQTIAIKTGGYKKKFFATAHFSNDFLCMIDAAANFFESGVNSVKRSGVISPVTRFEATLKSGRNLFVMGGLERLLVPSPLNHALKVQDPLKFEYPLPIGKPVTPEVREFLELVKSYTGTDKTKFQSRIVLTSSMWPETLENSGIARIWLDGVLEEVVQADKGFAELSDEDLVRRLYRSLRGHAYALAVIRSALDTMKGSSVCSDEERRHWLDHVVDRLSAVDLASRPAMAIAMAGRRLLDSKPEELTAMEGILQRVALCTTPVTPAAVQACYGSRDLSVDEVRRSLRWLQDSNLLIRVQYEHDSGFRSTAHTLVRNHVLTRMGYFPSAPAEAHSFEIAGWSSEVPDTLSGPGEGHELSIQSIDAMLNRLEEAGRVRRKTREETTHKTRRVKRHKSMKDHEYRHLIRATFGLIRSRWTATAIPRLSVLEPEATLRLPRPHYDAYQSRLAKLLNAIRTMKTIRELWLNEKVSGANKGPLRVEVELEDGALYADELAWLYNELGLVAFSTGLVADSYALFRAGQHVNAVAERGFQGHRWCASAINLGLVQIERGSLARGRYHLESAMRIAHTLKDKLLKARARGHLGLVHHLMGNYQHSEKLYNRAIKVLLRVGNHRGASIFLMHRADLRRRMHKFKEAASDLRESVAAAESGRHPDLVHYANLAIAKLKRTRKADSVTLEELTPAIDFARRVGIPRLECDAQMVQGQIALEQGEYDMAGRLAVSSLGIASSLGLRLRLTGGLILLGRVSEARGHWRGATKLYHAAIELAERQGNQLLIEKGEEALRASRSAEGRRATGLVLENTFDRAR